MILATDPGRPAAAWEVVEFRTDAEGAAIVARTTGYMPPNEKATERYLADVYEESPNDYAAVSQLPLPTKWCAFPRDKGLKITGVIEDRMNSIVNGARAGEPVAVLDDMARGVTALPPGL